MLKKIFQTQDDCDEEDTEAATDAEQTDKEEKEKMSNALTENLVNVDYFCDNL